MGASLLRSDGAEKDLFNIGSMPFTRKGSFFGVYADSSSMMIAGRSLYIGSRRGTSAERSDNILMRICPMYKGEKLDYGVRTTAAELILRTVYGEIRICMADPNLMLIKGENGLSLKLERNMATHEMMKKRGDRGWEEIIQSLGTVVYVPLKGTMEVNAPWDFEALSTPRADAVVLPDENGEFLLAADESMYGGVLRDSYPTYEEGLEDVTADWEAFRSCFPDLGPEFNEISEEAVWTLWSFIINASGRMNYPLIFMTGRSVASSWQMVQNAVAFKDNVPLRNDFLMNMLDEVSPQGQFPDFVDDYRSNAQGLKPPAQGWALKWIMKSHDLSKEMSTAELEKLYKGYAGWANWYMNVRDDDHDGLPEHEHGDDTGFDDSTVFVNTPEIEGPDLPSYLILLFESLGDIAKILGKTEEADDWYARAKKMLDQLTGELWNGEMFIARTTFTHEPVVSDSLLHYTPLVLGRRLPQEIIDRMTADLLKEGEFLCEYGLASEKIMSEQFRVSGMARGIVLPPYHMLILTGMYDAGKTEEAKMIAARYCRAMKKNGFSMLINPLKPAPGGFACSWPVSAFLILADMIHNM